MGGRGKEYGYWGGDGCRQGPAAEGEGEHETKAHLIWIEERDLGTEKTHCTTLNSRSSKSHKRDLSLRRTFHFGEQYRVSLSKVTTTKEHAWA
jgi:hypothetical protein